MDGIDAEQNGAVTTVNCDVVRGWEQWLYFGSDVHFDSIYCNRDYLEEHMREIKSKNAMAFFFGDWYDAMQGRYDKRRSMPELRPEYQQKENYYDLLVDSSFEFLNPYKDNIMMMSDGNHELSVLKNANTNIMDRLVGRLRKEGGPALHGGYGGWIRFMMNRSDTPQGSMKLKYFHGSGGEAPVTRGAIQTARQAVIYPDANIVVNGHSHNEYYIPISRERISNKGSQFFDIQHHLRVAGYKQAYGDGTTGWEITRGGVPKPIGCIWVKLFFREQMGCQIYPEVRGADPVSIPTNDYYNGRVYDEI